MGATWLLGKLMTDPEVAAGVAKFLQAGAKPAAAIAAQRRVFKGAGSELAGTK
jgi:hypothetical protein